MRPSVAAFHRSVAAVLVDHDLPPLTPAQRDEVLTFVDGQLAALPPHLRAGVTAVALVLAASAGVGRRGVDAARLDGWAEGPFPPARLYVRLLRSLVVYAGFEVLAEQEPTAVTT